MRKLNTKTNVLALAGLISLATLVLDPARLASAQVVAPSWSYTGNLNTARLPNTATLLPNGKVLVTLGFNSAELYDPAPGTWSITGNLNTAGGGTATLLLNGKVLVAGGNSAELYDPATGTWSITGNLNTARGDHTATLLPNGKVLVAGGYRGRIDDLSLRSAELYDPATGTWSRTGNLNTARGDHTATLLPSGKVLVVAGSQSSSSDPDPTIDAELYDPTTGMWSYTGSLNTGRIFHIMTLLPNGKVLVAGGLDYDGDALSSAELLGSGFPQITGASISGKKLLVEGQNFDVGARIILNDEKQKTANDELTATTLLIAKKAGNWIGPGETVRLKVRNSDGTESAEFAFTRAAQ